MINKIIDGISTAIGDEFGDDYNIYTESIAQELEEPCFSIYLVNPKNIQFLGNRYKRTNIFEIVYFPATKDINYECNEVLERLYSCLELIMVDGDLVRGTLPEGEVIDGVLHFAINFNMFMLKVNTEDNLMRELRHNTSVKE